MKLLRGSGTRGRAGPQLHKVPPALQQQLREDVGGFCHHHGPHRQRLAHSVTTITVTVCDLSFCKGQQTLSPFQLCCCEPSSLLIVPVTGGCTTASKCCPNTDCSNLLLGQSSPVFLEFSTFKTVNCLHTAGKEPQNRRS